MGWKRIRGSDVTKTYQQSASLALLVLGEVERGLYGAFLVDMVSTLDPHFIIDYKDKPKELATIVAARFLKWMSDKVKTTSDDVFRMCILFAQLTRKYKVFRLSVRNGDAILVEYLYEFFIPIWLVTAKHNYVEIALNQIEDLYGRVPFHVLQAARENRMQPLHVGSDRDGVPMAQWALDAIMELLQIKYKAMNFPNSREGWQKHSTNMPLVARCKTFCQTEYSHRYDVDSYDEQFLEFDAAGENQDMGNCKSQSKVPRRHQEKIMVSEILHLADAFIEKPGRSMKENTFWDVLKNLTTTLEKEDGTEGDTTNQGRSSGEEALVEVNHEILANAPTENEIPEDIQDASELDQLEWFRILDEENAALLDEEDEDEPTDVTTDPVVAETTDTTSEPVVAGTTETTTEPVVTGTSNTATEARTRNTPRVTEPPPRIVMDDAESEVQIGKNPKKVKVRKAKLNKMGLKDVVERGRSKMKEMKIPDVRFRRRCRMKRETKCLQIGLNEYLNSENGSIKMNSILEKFTIGESVGFTDERVEFRIMASGTWVIPHSNESSNRN
jgi:hypothetical protein